MKEENNAGKRTMTEAEKKVLMWNIIQPGDPYDIRKSMIAKLPGQTKFMGPHLQLICLLQAAQIERLCLYLEQHKVKSRQNERLELDRHSYEVQIKELTQKLTDLQNYKRQNEKLKQYIRKQTIELEQLQKQQNNIGLTTKYQNSLRQIHSIIVEKEKLQDNNKNLEKQNHSLKQQNKFNQQTKIRQLQVLSKEIKQLNNMKLQQELKYRQKSNKSDIQKRKLQMQQISLNKKYQQVFQAFKDLENANQALKRQLDKARYQAGKVEQYKKTLKDYEQRFVKAAQEIDRLNDVIKQKSRILNEQYQKSKQLAESIKIKDEQLAQKDNAINELQKSNSILQRQQRQALISLGNMEQNKIIIKSYQASLSQFSIEVQRLNNILPNKQTDIQDLKQRNIQHEKKIKALEISLRQSAQYKVKYGQIIKRINDGQIQNSRLQQQVQTLKLELQKSFLQKKEAQARNENYEDQFQNLKGTIATLSSQIDRKNVERQSQIKNEYLAEIQKLNGIISLQKQTNRENQEKIGYYLRQIKLLQSQLREKQGYSKLFRSYYDSTQQLKVPAVLAYNNQEYINDLKKKIRQLQLQLKNVQSPQNMQEKYEPQQQTTKFAKGQSFKTTQEQIENLKDLLLSKQIQNNRLAEINEQLRQMMHSSKQISNQSPYSQGKIQQISSSQFSPGVKRQIAKIQKQPVRKKQPKDWGIQIEQEISVNKKQNLQDYPQRPRKDFKQEQQLQMEIPPHKILERSKQKRQSTQKGQSQYSYQRSNQRQRYPYSIYQQSPQPKSDLGTYERQQTRQREEEYPQIIPQHYIFKKLLQQHQNKQQTPEVIVQFNQKYQQVLNTYENLYQSHYRLNHQKRYLNEQKQANENYINLLTDKIQLLNNQISQIKQIIDPKLYQQNLEGQLRKSYSLLLQKYNNAVFDNDILRTKLKKYREISPRQRIYTQEQSQFQRLYAENEELKANCAQFSQYYNKILMINDQLQRVNKILLGKERQIKSKDITIRDYEFQKLNYQNLIRQMDKKLFQLTGQSQINLPLAIQSQSDKLPRQLTLLRKRNSDLQRLVKSYQLEQPRISNDVSNQQRKKWQSQMQLMSLQIARLNSLLLNKKKDIEALQQQNKSLKRNITQNKRSSRVYQDNTSSLTKYEEKIVVLSQELQRLNNLLRIKEQNQLTLKNQFTQYQDLTKKHLSAYSSETDRLNEEVSNLRIEVEQIRTKDQSGSQNGKYLSGNNISEYQARLLELSRQIDRLNNILANNREQINDLSSKDANYRSQIERLNNSLRLKVEESIMSQTKEKAFIEQKKFLTRQIEENARQYEELTERYRVLEEENGKFSHHLKEYQKRIKGFYDESQRLQKIIQLLKSQGSVQGDESITQLIQKNRYLIQQIERLNEVVYKQRQQLSDLRLNFADQTSLQKRINQDLGLFVVLFAQIESLRNRAIEQQNQVEKLCKTSVALRKA